MTDKIKHYFKKNMVLSQYGRDLISPKKLIVRSRPKSEPTQTFTREECEEMIEFAINQHNRNAGLISMALGFAFIALFADGLFRVLGLIPPFLGIDVSVVQDVVDKLKDEVLRQM
tara:strand:- start:361 stop:705 length:345 start_codon:yes stop_codon:yes gene_type:complete